MDGLAWGIITPKFTYQVEVTHSKSLSEHPGNDQISSDSDNEPNEAKRETESETYSQVIDKAVKMSGDTPEYKLDRKRTGNMK